MQQKLDPLLRRRRLRKEISRVALSSDLIELEVPVAEPLLDLKILDIKVANLAEPLTSADALESRAICPDPQP